MISLLASSYISFRAEENSWKYLDKIKIQSKIKKGTRKNSTFKTKGTNC